MLMRNDETLLSSIKLDLRFPSLLVSSSQRPWKPASEKSAMECLEDTRNELTLLSPTCVFCRLEIDDETSMHVPAKSNAVQSVDGGAGVEVGTSVAVLGGGRVATGRGASAAGSDELPLEGSLLDESLIACEPELLSTICRIEPSSF